MPDRVLAAWVGADETSVYLSGRSVFEPHALSEPSRLVLPVLFPREQKLLPAQGSRAHLVWLDAAPAGSEDGARLWSAILTPDLAIERTSTLLTDRSVYHYAAAARDERSYQVVWSSGLLAEPALTSRVIDQTGRAGVPQVLSAHGDWPALVRTNAGTVWLFWINRGVVYRGIVSEAGELSYITAATQAVELGRGDRLVNFEAGLDRTHGYLIWNIIRAGGTVETWLASGALTTPQWDNPVRLQISVKADEPFITGFNGGTANAASAGDSAVMWAAPLTGQSDYLVLAGGVDDEMGLLYLQAGHIQGYQAVVKGVMLSGQPSLQTDINGHLYLAWSERTEQPVGSIYLTMTK